MKMRLIPALVFLLGALACEESFAQASRSRLTENLEPGAISLEGILPKPIRVTVAAESPIYYQSDMQRVLGSMAPGTVVQLVAITDSAWKVRGRARHGDVAGWM